jgi:predicted nuclease of predicted toxin-antitoxin system
VNILLDECLDWRLARDLPGHNVKTVQDMGWAGVKNGKLLSLAQERFEVFITGDLNLSYQQNMSKYSIAVVVLHAESTRLFHLRPLMPKECAMLPALQVGQLVSIGAGHAS